MKRTQFLVRNPEYSLSKSVLVFVLKKNHADEKNTFAENKFIQDKLV